MPLTLAPARGRHSKLTPRVLAACRPGRTDREVAEIVGCHVTTAATIRRANGVPPGLERGKAPPPPGGPPVPHELARSLGLAVVEVTDSRPWFWLVSDAATGKTLGTYVPYTRSCEVLGVVHAGLSDPALVLGLYAAVRRG